MSGQLFDLKGDDAIVLRVHVHPGAGRTTVAGSHGDALKIRVGAPPAGGRANEACTEMVAELFGVKPANVELTSGAKSRQKRFTVSGVDQAEAEHLLSEALSQAELRPGERATPGSGANRPE